MVSISPFFGILGPTEWMAGDMFEACFGLKADENENTASFSSPKEKNTVASVMQAGDVPFFSAKRDVRHLGKIHDNL